MLTGTIRIVDDSGRVWYPTRFENKDQLRNFLRNRQEIYRRKLETGEWTLSIIVDADNDFLITTLDDAGIMARD